METKELGIQIPENQEIDWQESAKQEKIVFKKIDKPKSWEEYLKANNHPSLQYTINQNGFVVKTFENECAGDLNHVANRMKLYLPSKEYAEAFIAMMQLMSLRQAWIGEWKPDWTNKYSVKYCICYEFNFDTKADWTPTGKFAVCANWIKGYFNVQVGIRTFIKVVRPHLLANENCQEAHLVDNEGNPRYNWDTRPLIFTDNSGKKVVALKADDGNYTLLPYESYTQIKKLVKEEL